MIPIHHAGEIHLTKDKITGWFHPIDLKLWARIIGFHRYISKKYDAESVSYHRWNKDKGRYDTIIPFQETIGNGLSVDTDWEDRRNIQLLDDYYKRHGVEFFPACTIHTHVDAAAFESGTDAKDEEEQPGWHITIGHLVTHPEYDLSARFRLPKKPKVKRFTSAEVSYDMQPELMFPAGVEMDRVITMPDTDHEWRKHEHRVEVTRFASIGGANWKAQQGVRQSGGYSGTGQSYLQYPNYKKGK